MNQDRGLKTRTDRAVGTAGGGVAGTATGTKAAEAVNPAMEDAYWSANYRERDYVELHRPYSDYRPAYQYGWEAYARLGNRPFREVEGELERGWVAAKGDSKLAWTEAKPATSDAWHHLDRSRPIVATRTSR